jgi:ribosomal-protein-serine acetyltransferase
MLVLRPDPSLVLRTIEESDAAPIFMLVDANRRHLGSWLQFVHATQSEADTLAFIRSVAARDREGGGCALVIEESGVPCGVIGLDPIEQNHQHASIGYWLVQSAQGRGVMTRALGAVVRHAFDDLGLHRLALYAAVDNTRSRAVARRLGFQEEGIHRQSEKNLDRFLDMVSYSLLRSDRAG